MSDTKSDRNRDVLLRFIEIINAGDVERIEEVADAELLTVQPQTRERIPGLEAFKEVARGFDQMGGIAVSEEERELLGGEEERYLLTPLFTMVKVQGSGEALVLTTKVRYPDGSDWYTIGLFSFQAGRIVKQVLFSAPTLYPPEWRAEWVEPLVAQKGVSVEKDTAREPGSRRTVDRGVSERLFAFMDGGEYERLGEVFRTDVITDYPQTGERARGLESLENIMRRYPGGHPIVSPDERVVVGDRGEHRLLTPADSMLTIHDAGDRLMASIKTRYPDGSDWYWVSIFSFLEGKISKQVLYFAPVMPAPEWRAKWVVPQIGRY